MAIAVIGMGLPGSGKTSKMKLLAEEMQAFYISTKEVREQSYRHPMAWQDPRLIWKIVHARASKALMANKDVVIDSTHFKRRDRVATFRSCFFADEIVLHWYQAPLEYCIQRNADSERPIPRTAIERMYKLMLEQPPVAAEGYSRLEIIDNSAPNK